MTTHLNKKNKPTIVNIIEKKNTIRYALAEGKVKFSEKVFKKLIDLKTKKGEITSIAIIAGILGAKKTSELIPLCHNINLENINIDIKTNIKTKTFTVVAEAKTYGKTGVEMEALTAVTISCLTIYDMCKSLDKSILITDIKLLVKKGGKSDFEQNKNIKD